MNLNANNVYDYLANFALEDLFLEELGWDSFREEFDVNIDDANYPMQGIAEKRGVRIYQCRCDTLPNYQTRKRIEQQVTPYAFEHLIIFVDGDETTQIWQWVARGQDRRTAYREHTYRRGNRDRALIQKLEKIVFTLQEEEGITLAGATKRLADAFDREPLTKKFYAQFKKEHDAFLKFVEGIEASADREWYTSVMLNRLMFVYFLQRAGFLDGDTDYLNTRLQAVQAQRGDGEFHSFYRYFLLRLFHEGLGQQERNPELEKLIGNIPYLNGGLFDIHELERQYPDIHITDEAFEKIFAFFDDWEWHLDNDPLRESNEINPDVLGYIFEKYINQKQMGAYYTKEDITEYISKNTIIPFVLDRALERCPQAFTGEQGAWALLQADPDRYIYEAVRRGTDKELPAHIAQGIDDVSKRDEWNTPTDDDYALPTEIWRETVARRQRYDDIKGKLERGEVTEVNALITYNLDIIQFMQDVLENTESPELVQTVWTVLVGRPDGGDNYQPGLSVLDPTCGSGAFLFAALNILQPIYEACLDRMESFVSDAERAEGTNNYEGFERILADVQKHPNRDYYVLKTLILNNLYGVDIMPEAVEIAKLRLFLKLVAQVEPNPRSKNLGIEALPDIDFNIRAGNTLVGYTSYYAIKEAIEGGQGDGQLIRMDMFDAMTPIANKAAEVDALFREFRRQQVLLDANNSEQIANIKQELREKQAELNDVLNEQLARDYGVNTEKEGEYEQWLESHQPFHWYTEFYGIMQDGFDIIVGNPPYVEYKDVKRTYTVMGYATQDANDLYAFVTERAIKMLKDSSLIGVIIPISAFGVNQFQSLQQFILNKLNALWLSHYANRPSQVFQGAQKRLTIILGKKHISSVKHCDVNSSSYLRWKKSERSNLLFSQLTYTNIKDFYSVFDASLEKLGSPLVAGLFSKLIASGDKLALDVLSQSTPHTVYYTRKFGYFLDFFDFIPQIIDKRTNTTRNPSELKELYFASEESSLAVIAALSSSTFFLYWNILSDCRNLNKRDLLSFPLRPKNLSKDVFSDLIKLGQEYIDFLRSTSTWMNKAHLKIETFEYTRAKPLIDEIDRVLAQHYGFTDEELDFIINYDIKYRMGSDLFEEDE
jgi:hypothetical protein